MGNYSELLGALGRIRSSNRDAVILVPEASWNEWVWVFSVGVNEQTSGTAVTLENGSVIQIAPATASPSAPGCGPFDLYPVGFEAARQGDQKGFRAWASIGHLCEA